MDAVAARDAYPGLAEQSFNPKHAVSWIEEKPATAQVLYAHDVFQDLLQSAARPKQSSGHACVKLCGFVDQCAKAESAALREYAFAEKTAYDLFNFYVEWNEQDQHRSMRLVLDLLKLSIAKNPDQETGTSIKTRILHDTISYITLRSTKPSIKSALTALDYFLQKKLICLSDILGTYRQLHQSPEHDVDWDSLIAKVFAWMEMKNIWPIAGKLLVSIFTAPQNQDEGAMFRPDSWHRFLHAGVTANVELLEAFQIYTLIPLFKTDKEQMLQYLDDLFSLQGLTKDQTNLDISSMIWLAALEAGKKVGVLGEPGSETDGKSHLQQGVLEDILSHTSHEARSSAVSILIASPSTTKPYTTGSLDLLRKHLPAFHADTDAKFRYDVLGLSRNMIARILGAIAALRRDCERKFKKTKKNEARSDLPDSNSNATNAIAELKSLLQHHEEFLSWYLSFLKHELVPTASYQRHITSLKVMEFILKSGLLKGYHDETQETKLKVPLFETTWLRAVLDLIMDPFEDVRETAAGLLLLLSSSDGTTLLTDIPTPMVDSLEEFCTRANTLALRTSRADHSDGVARSFEVLCHWTVSREDKLAIPGRVLEDLETKLSAAEHDLASAVLDAPIHGGFAALRYIWGSLSSVKYTQGELDVLSSLQSRAVACCQRIWSTVRVVLCDDSPEGHLPEELEEVDGLDTKDLLSYSFRAIHESSHLLRVIAGNARSPQNAGLVRPSSDTFEVIGNLTFDQLSNLRHRGAFTTVSQTFSSCCQLVKWFPSPSADGQGLLDQWYQGALKCIYGQASTTRRSAGIPALVVGILSSNATQPSFHTVMLQLQDIARQEARISETDGSNLPQVHALNCIKDIFKSSMLSRRAEPYLTDCLQLAASSLKSEVWAIRNCGLILLRSLIDVLFGTSESKTSMEAGWDGRTTRIAWHKYPALPALLVSLLEAGQVNIDLTKGATAESVFPALDIIRRAGPPQDFKDKLYGTVSWYLGSHFWHVREIAARTLCSFLLRPQWLEPLRDILRESQSSANKLHGALLTFKFLLERLLDAMPEQLIKEYPAGLLDLIEEIRSANGSFQTCSEARAVYYEIITFINELSTSQALSSKSQEAVLIEPASAQLSNTQQRHNPSALELSKKARASAGYDLQKVTTSSWKGLNIGLSSTIDDINVTCDMLEEVLVSYEANHLSSFDQATEAALMETCMATCSETDAPEPRALALKIITIQLDRILGQGSRDILPSKERLTALWDGLQTKPMNPGLADSVIQASGSLMAAIIKQPSEDGQDPSPASHLRSWGVMIAHAGSVDNGFDTRMSGIQAVRSFTSHTDLSAPSPAHLPVLLALYDYLNDDDDEIRDAAAAATLPILGKPLVSMEAGARLLSWLGARFSDDTEFRAHVACRLVGHPAVPAAAAARATEALLRDWAPAADQLATALRFDDALFVVEEQNLYVDEVREARRWRDVYVQIRLASSPGSQERKEAAGPGVATTADDEKLVEWTTAGLRTLAQLADAHRDDGVLGWASKPEVFAICARVVTAGAVLADAHPGVKEELRRFVEKGAGSRVHGLLLGMCGRE
ncbi:hypothetical protein JX266_008966 [Neoarthrinium moseri]|nr:hypothetical protein JX266_008966 [Neoarthrinium moseri]